MHNVCIYVCIINRDKCIFNCLLIRTENIVIEFFDGNKVTYNDAAQVVPFLVASVATVRRSGMLLIIEGIDGKHPLKKKISSPVLPSTFHVFVCVLSKIN